MKLTKISAVSFGAWVVLFLMASGARADDWPTWRHDPNRSAATEEQLSPELHVQWSRKYLPLKPAWYDPRLHFDAVYEPVVMGKTMFVGSSLNDSVTAIDTGTGEERWRFFANGPVRFAPIAVDGRVYFGADDGCLYCVTAADGSEVWKYSAAPSNRKILGNDRLISVWPIRGGPILADGKIQFTAGVWPFEGNFLITLDAESGRVLQRETLTDLSPQGYLATNGSDLFIPCGRAAAACLDRETGLFRRLSYDTSRTSVHLSAVGPWLFHGDICYQIDFLRRMFVVAPHPVLTNDAVYFGRSLTAHAYYLKRPTVVEVTDRHGQRSQETTLREPWSLQVTQALDQAAGARERALRNPVRIDCKAGDRLYGHQGDTVFAIDLPGRGPVVSWKEKVEGTPSSMIVADGRLFVITREGWIHCFGAERKPPTRYLDDSAARIHENNQWSAKVRSILQQSGMREGYGLVLGVGRGRLVEALIEQSSLPVIAVDPDIQKVNKLRRRLTSAGLYGSRVSVHVGDPQTFELPPYLASLVISEDLGAAGISDQGAFAETFFPALRPFGGTICLDISASGHERLAQRVVDLGLRDATVRRTDSYSLLVREGALPGSADWTHEYGNSTNNLMSQDMLVKPPLGVLWFGGPTANGDLFFDRHRWPPGLAVIEGRMFIQGPGVITAVDVYTGRILWRTELPKMVSAGRRGNNRLVGVHMVAVNDGIYIAYGKSCRLLDPVNGKTISEFKLPSDTGVWGRIRIWNDVLVGAVFRQTQALGKTSNLPVEIFAMDRYSGKILWSKSSELSFPFVAVGNGKVFCFEGALEDLYRHGIRRGITPRADSVSFFAAFDVQTGRQLWKAETDMTAAWLGYSEDHNVLIASNKEGIVAFDGDEGQQLWAKFSVGVGFRGHPEGVWDKVIAAGDWVIDQRGPGVAYETRTGNPVMRDHPITGEQVRWEFARSGHHCSYAVANPHLVTFRAASAGFCDINTGTSSRLSGFRSGCRNSLIPANGVLNAPNFAYGCTCGYPLFTSFALVHRLENEMWTYSPMRFNTKEERIRRIGVNLGAPGDRPGRNGTFWLGHPNDNNSSVNVDVAVEGAPKYFRQHTTHMNAGESWIFSSGVEGARSIKLKLAPGIKERRGPGVRISVASGSDDAEEDDFGSMYIDSSDLELVHDDADQIIGIRFQDVSIAPATQIKSAYVQFQVDEASTEYAALKIYGEATGDALPFTTQQSDISKRKKTKAAVVWKPMPWDQVGFSGVDQRTPNLAPILQEIVDRPDWIAGRALALLISGSGRRTAESFEGDTEGAATLVIEAEAPSLVQSPFTRDTSHVVRLYFAEPDNTVGLGDRVFDVTLQGKSVLTHFDVFRETRGRHRGVIKEFGGVQAGNDIRVEFSPGEGTPVISGIEIVEEED